MKIKKHTSDGFTLVELIIILAIMGIFISMAVPSFTNTMNRSKVQDVVRGFEGALKIAKRTARTSGRQINICPTDDITAEHPICGNWDKFKNDEKADKLGWFVYRIINRSMIIKTKNDDGTETETKTQSVELKAIKKVPFNKSSVRVQWSNNAAIAIMPRGATFKNATLCVYIPNKDITIDKCNTGKEIGDKLKQVYGARLVLSKLGAIRIEKFYQ